MSNAGLVLSDLAKRDMDVVKLPIYLAPRQNIDWLNEINIKGNLQILVILSIIFGIFVVGTILYHCGRHIPVLDMSAWLTCRLMDVVEFVIYLIVLVVKAVKNVVVGVGKHAIRFFKVDLPIFFGNCFSLNFWKQFFRKLFRMKEEKEVNLEVNRGAIEMDDMSHLEELSSVHTHRPAKYPIATIHREGPPRARVGRREFANASARSQLSESNVAHLSEVDITDAAQPRAQPRDQRPKAETVYDNISFVWSSSSSEYDMETRYSRSSVGSGMRQMTAAQRDELIAGEDAMKADVIKHFSEMEARQERQVAEEAKKREAVEAAKHEL